MKEITYRAHCRKCESPNFIIEDKSQHLQNDVNTVIPNISIICANCGNRDDYQNRGYAVNTVTMTNLFKWKERK